MDVYQRRRCAIAYTKIIPVRHHLQRCLDYTSNPNKTEIFTESDLKRLLSYTQNQDKTEHQLYVSGFQCDPDTACQSMEETKRVWFMPTDKGILAYHIIQSFSPGEATPEQVHQIGCEFARRFLADRFECTVSTHLDKGHLHNHIVTNSVSFIDGRMFRNDFDTYYNGIRKISDELCRENRLSVIETDGKGQGYADWLSGKTGKPTIRSMVRKDVELAIAAADTFDGFIAELQAMGYTVKYGPRVEHMAVRHQSAQRSVRIDRLDARYSESALRDYYRQICAGNIKRSTPRSLPSGCPRSLRLWANECGTAAAYPNRTARYPGLWLAIIATALCCAKPTTAKPRNVAIFCCARTSKNSTAISSRHIFCGNTACKLLPRCRPTRAI